MAKGYKDEKEEIRSKGVGKSTQTSACRRLPNWPWFGCSFSHLCTEIDVARVQPSWKHLVGFTTMEYFYLLVFPYACLEQGVKHNILRNADRSHKVDKDICTCFLDGHELQIKLP